MSRANLVRRALVLGLAAGFAVPGAAVGGQAGEAAHALAGQPAARPGPKTLGGVQAAHLASRRMGDFALRAARVADAEKRPVVASFFRAAARSAEVNAGLLAAVLGAGGAKPLEDADPPATGKTTVENLAQFNALASASRERASAAAVDARAEGDAATRRVLDFQREATTELLRLARDAARPPSAGADAKPPEYHVSRTCGYVIDRLDIERCPVCLAGKGDFERVK